MYRIHSNSPTTVDIQTSHQTIIISRTVNERDVQIHQVHRSSAPGGGIIEAGGSLPRTPILGGGVDTKPFGA